MANGTPAGPEVGGVQGQQRWQEGESALAVLPFLPPPPASLSLFRLLLPSSHTANITLGVRALLNTSS